MNVEIKLTTEDIIKATSGILINGDMGIIFRGISTDTRIIKPGYLFIALKGEKFDGHDFYKTAIEKGAKGLVFSHFPKGFKVEEIPKTISVILVKDTLKALGDIASFWREKLNSTFVAITGSCGKTTTKELTYNILSRFLKAFKNEANYNNLIGVPLSLLSIKENRDVAILELGTNQKGEIEREGERIRLKVWKEKDVDKIWRAMRYLQWFDVSDLVQLGFKPGTVRYVVYVLWKKGDLVRQKVNGKYKYRVVSEERGRLTYDELKKKECGRD